MEDDSFSDDDNSEDGGRKKKGKKGAAKKDTGASSAPTKKGARQKECPSCGVKVGVSIKECPNCDHSFTTRSNLVQQTSVEEESANIRGRFPFEPERDEEGSLMIERIMGRRLRKDKARQYHKSSSQFIERGAEDTKYDHEYLIKFKTMSYLHCQWLSAHEIDMMSKRSKMALSRYLKALDQGSSAVQEDGEIDPTFVEVEKVLDVREEEVFETQQDDKPVAGEDVVAAAAAAAAADADAMDVVPAPALQPSSSSSTAPNAASDAAASAPGAPGGALSAVKSTGSLSALGDTEPEPKIDPVTGEVIQVTLSITAVFKPTERCQRVLDRIWDDPFASSFVDPVDTDLYEDYLDIVDEPMCLSEVKQRLEDGAYSKYGAHSLFAKDVRLIFQNCKAYNLYKSQIWHSAHCLQMLFERLYQGWVVSFSDGSIPMSELVGCPWEQTCRVCAVPENEDKMILCDHCDSIYHMACLTPPMVDVPDGSWYCPRCVSWFESHPSAKRLTATAEDEAREATTQATAQKIVKVRKTKYLVKWRGLSHIWCSWESREDINDDEKIQEYHLINDNPPEEPPLTQEELNAELRKDKFKQTMPAKDLKSHFNPVYESEAHIYAQMRAFHFLRYNRMPPRALVIESGPGAAKYAYSGPVAQKLPSDVAKILRDIESKAPAAAAAEAAAEAAASSASSSAFSGAGASAGAGQANSSSSSSGGVGDNERKPRTRDDRMPTLFVPDRSVHDSIRADVADLVSCMCSSIARNTPMPSYPARPKLPAPDLAMPTEIEVVVPKGANGRFFFVAGDYNGRLVVHEWSTDKKGPMQLLGRVRLGDVLTAINGVSVTHLSYNQVVKLLAWVSTPYVYLRFLRTQECAGEYGCIARARAENAPNIQQLRLMAAREKAGKDIAPENDEVIQEGDVYTRYLSMRRPVRDSLTPKPLRSTFHGVFPCVDDGQQRWMAYYGLGPAESVSYKMVSKAVNALLKTKIETVSVPNPAGGFLFATERDAAVAREAHMLAVPKAKAGPVIYAATLNFTSADCKSRTPSSALLERLVLAERAEGEILAQRRVGFIAGKLGLDADGSSRLMHVDNDSDDEDQGIRDDMSLDSLDSDSDQNSIDWKAEEEEHNSDDDDDMIWDDETGDWASAKKLKERQPLVEGAVTRLHQAICEAQHPPMRSEWSKYMVENFTEGAIAQSKSGSSANLTAKPEVPGGNRKGVPVDQLDLATGMLIHTWKSANAACMALNVTSYQITQCCLGKMGDAGGFRWRYSDPANPLAKGGDEDDVEPIEDAEEVAERAAVWKAKLHKKSKEYRSGGTLREYQVEGLNWLLRCWYQRRSCIIADEM